MGVSPGIYNSILGIGKYRVEYKIDTGVVDVRTSTDNPSTAPLESRLDRGTPHLPIRSRQGIPSRKAKQEQICQFSCECPPPGNPLRERSCRAAPRTQAKDRARLLILTRGRE